MERDDIPIILTVFGTTRSQGAYHELYQAVKKAFPRHHVALAFTSRMVHATEAREKGADNVPPLPSQMLDSLARQGHNWAVVQSVHMLAAHEFYRMVEEVHGSTLRASIGLPLLWAMEDYEWVARAIQDEYQPMGDSETALVFIGHGTDHASWSSYPALEHAMRQRGMDNAWVGVVEGEPGMQRVLEQVLEKGFKKALLVPLMLVAGVHVIEDIEGDGQGGRGWKAAFEAQGIATNTIRKGLLEMEAIRRIFIRHVEEAMELALPRRQKGA